MYYDWRDIVAGAAKAIFCAAIGLALVFAASMVWHYGAWVISECLP